MCKRPAAPRIMKSSKCFMSETAVTGRGGFWAGIVLLLLGLVGQPGQAEELTEVIDRIRPSIVAVGTVQQTRRPPALFRGTGFVVGDGHHVLTNAHVLPEQLNKRGQETLAVFAGRGRRFEARPATAVAVDEEHDLALLKISGSRLSPLSLGGSRPVREGQLVAFTGFPLGMVLGLYPVTHRGIISAISPVAIPVPAARQLDPAMIRRLQDPYEVFQLDATAYPGNSGSPLYEPDTGRVIGIINKVFVKKTKETVLQNPSGITYAIPVKHAQALLAR